MQVTDEQAQMRIERMHRSDEWYFRWRKGLTIIFGFDLLWAIWEISQKRSQWPGLLSLHALSQLRNVRSVECNVFCMCVWIGLLIQVWTAVDRYRREQARLEQERLMQNEATAAGVWPPKPTPPIV